MHFSAGAGALLPMIFETIAPFMSEPRLLRDRATAWVVTEIWQAARIALGATSSAMGKLWSCTSFARALSATT